MTGEVASISSESAPSLRLLRRALAGWIRVRSGFQFDLACRPAGRGAKDTGKGMEIMTRASSCLAAAFLAAFVTYASAQVSDFKPVTREMLANPDAGDWLMLNRTY